MLPHGGLPVNILVSGSTGLVGSALCPALRQAGHRVTRLVRTRPASATGDAWWNPEAGQIDPPGPDGFDAVVHLAGEGIAAGRWTAGQKARIRDSRVQGTGLIANAIARASRPPRVLVSASAIGYYGDRGETVLTEEAAPGQGFLPEVCRAWEDATSAALTRGVRVVRLRIGVVLSPKGGALAKMLPPFRLGFGGRLGTGKQYMSWISLEDLVGVIRAALQNDTLTGPVNAVSPLPVTNSAFTAALAATLHRPALFPMPAFAARLAFGEMADALLLASARVEPARLLAAGHIFRHPALPQALLELLPG